MGCKHGEIFFQTCGSFFHLEDHEMNHVEEEVDPIRDLDIINDKLRLKDEECYENCLDLRSDLKYIIILQLRSSLKLWLHL